jgi:hypothetical protein
MGRGMRSERDTYAEALRDAAHDAFMAFWHAMDTDQATALWAAYCVAQERYERRLQARVVQPACQ